MVSTAIFFPKTLIPFCYFKKLLNSAWKRNELAPRNKVSCLKQGSEEFQGVLSTFLSSFLSRFTSTFLSRFMFTFMLRDFFVECNVDFSVDIFCNPT